jgi:hypothetical protein
MTESPLIREAVAEGRHKDILRVLGNRFGLVPPNLEAEVRSILDETVLDAALDLAMFSSDLEQFGTELRAIPRPPEPWDPADEPEPNVENRGENGQDAGSFPRAESGTTGSEKRHDRNWLSHPRAIGSTEGVLQDPDPGCARARPAEAPPGTGSLRDGHREGAGE